MGAPKTDKTWRSTNHNSIISLRDVFQSLLRVKRQRAAMNTVLECPKSLAEIKIARRKMQCGHDQYGRNQYMCIPNEELTALKEFCFPGVMGLQEKGHCLAVSTDGILATKECTDFSSGCPSKYYHYDGLYMHHACQRINTQNGCYLERQSCPPMPSNIPPLEGKHISIEKNGGSVLTTSIPLTSSVDLVTSQSQPDNPILTATIKFPTESPTKHKEIMPSPTQSDILPSKNSKIVSQCPRSEEEVNKARSRMRCGNDQYGRNQYLCVPNEQLTGFKEICVDGVMGLQEKGHCLVVSKEEEVIAKSCKDFSSGCPEAFYHYDDFYKYPNCQKINTQKHCYIERPLCSPGRSFIDRNDLYKISPTGKNNGFTKKRLMTSLALFSPFTMTSDTSLPQVVPTIRSSDRILEQTFYESPMKSDLFSQMFSPPVAIYRKPYETKYALKESRKESELLSRMISSSLTATETSYEPLYAHGNRIDSLHSSYENFVHQETETMSTHVLYTDRRPLESSYQDLMISGVSSLERHMPVSSTASMLATSSTLAPIPGENENRSRSVPNNFGIAAIGLSAVGSCYLVLFVILVIVGYCLYQRCTQQRDRRRNTDGEIGENAERDQLYS